MDISESGNFKVDSFSGQNYSVRMYIQISEIIFDDSKFDLVPSSAEFKPMGVHLKCSILVLSWISPILCETNFEFPSIALDPVNHTFWVRPEEHLHNRYIQFIFDWLCESRCHSCLKFYFGYRVVQHVFLMKWVKHLFSHILSQLEGKKLLQKPSHCCHKR